MPQVGLTLRGIHPDRPNKSNNLADLSWLKKREAPPTTAVVALIAASHDVPFL
jgi:hypothetical protein